MLHTAEISHGQVFGWNIQILYIQKLKISSRFYCQKIVERYNYEHVTVSVNIRFPQLVCKELIRPDRFRR